MANIKNVNKEIKELKSTDKVSDGYHTFGELYEHRITLYIALCKLIYTNGSAPEVWRSKVHSDGSKLDGWFVLGIDKRRGKQITYHLPLDRWNETGFAETLKKAPMFDKHTSSNVLERIKKL